MTTIRTILGDVPASGLGRTNYHEHLFQVSPILPGDEITDEDRSAMEARLLVESGFDAMVDATPYGLGRRADAVARISEHTGLRVLATTGAHRQVHYSPGHWLLERTEGELADLFTTDVTEGMPAAETTWEEARGGRALNAAQSLRSGLIKAGIGYWEISPFERRVLHAVAAAHVATGAPVMVHLEFCTAAHEVLDILAEGGVQERHVILAHADRDPDAILHGELCARGAFLGYDGITRPRSGSEEALIGLIGRVIDAGGASNILIGADVARASRYVAYGGMPGLGYLGRRFLPRLAGQLGQEVVDSLLTTNPARALALGGTPTTH